jgi:hypothetical protein
MSLMPTRLMGSRRVSGRPWTSSTVARGVLGLVADVVHESAPLRRTSLAAPAAPTSARPRLRCSPHPGPPACRHCSREPCSMKRSGMPRCRSATCKPAAARSSPTPEPAPPAVAFSSSVTMARWRVGHRHHEILIERLHKAHVDERCVEALGDSLRRLNERAECQIAQGRAAFAPKLRAPDGQRAHFGRRPRIRVPVPRG